VIVADVIASKQWCQIDPAVFLTMHLESAVLHHHAFATSTGLLYWGG
jgi:hypothetical protein